MASQRNTIVEGHLEFAFGSSWHVIKYDDHRDYQDKIKRLDGTKALDFVAVHRTKPETLYLIEVKDFRGSRIENKARLSNGELAVEVGQKVRDTLAGIIGGFHGVNVGDWKPVMERIMTTDQPIKIVLWLEEDLPLPSRPRGRGVQQRTVMMNILKNRLRWLTTKVFVASLQDGADVMPELAVKSLSGARRP